MAEGKPISKDDLIEPGIIKQLIDELGKLKDQFSNMYGKSSQNVKDTNEAIKDTLDITEDLLRLQKVQIRLEKEIENLEKNKANLNSKQLAHLTSLKEQRKQNNVELNTEARLNNQIKGSMNQLSQALAKNKLEYRKLTEEERKNNKERSRSRSFRNRWDSRKTFRDKRT